MSPRTLLGNNGFWRAFPCFLLIFHHFQRVPMAQVLGRLKLDGRAKPLRPGSALHAVTPLQNLAKTLVFIRFYKGFLQGLGKNAKSNFSHASAGFELFGGNASFDQRKPRPNTKNVEFLLKNTNQNSIFLHFRALRARKFFEFRALRARNSLIFFTFCDGMLFATKK